MYLKYIVGRTHTVMLLSKLKQWLSTGFREAHHFVVFEEDASWLCFFISLFSNSLSNPNREIIKFCMVLSASMKNWLRQCTPETYNELLLTFADDMFSRRTSWTYFYFNKTDAMECCVCGCCCFSKIILNPSNARCEHWETENTKQCIFFIKLTTMTTINGFR